MKKLTTEQRLEGYLDFEKEGLGPPNLMSFLRGIAFAEGHYESVGNSDTLEKSNAQQLIEILDAAIEEMGRLNKLLEELDQNQTPTKQDQSTDLSAPIGYIITIDPAKSYRKDSWEPWKEVVGINGGKIDNNIPDGSFVYLHPPKDKPFIRLTRDEISTAWAHCDDVIIFVREIERLLEEKNK